MSEASSEVGEAPAAADACPLCGAPLAPEQDWCLHCGAAARTRLSATPNWKAPLAAVIAVAVLLLGVLAAALVALAHGPGPAPAAVTRVVVTTGAPTTPAPGTGTTSPTGPTRASTTTGPTGASAPTGSTGTTTTP